MALDKEIGGNGTWADLRLFRGRGYHKDMCRRHFPKTCKLVIEHAPEVWTNPWSHVLLSVLLPGSWVPFHHGLTNGQLTYHLPVEVPTEDLGAAELAVVPRPGADVVPEGANEVA